MYIFPGNQRKTTSFPRSAWERTALDALRPGYSFKAMISDRGRRASRAVRSHAERRAWERGGSLQAQDIDFRVSNLDGQSITIVNLRPVLPTHSFRVGADGETDRRYLGFMHSYSPLKEALRRWIPQPLLRVRRSWVNRQRSRQTDRLNTALQGRVLSGPFSGMRYPAAAAVGSAAGPKLLGTYEAELHDVVRSLPNQGFDRIVNVGSGEGYYAVGLLILMPHARGIAFEVEEQGQKLSREMARLNGVEDRVDVRGCCSPQDLAEALRDANRGLVVMDVEGAEDLLLNPEGCPGLHKSAVLVEVHEYLKPGVTEHLLAWYSPTHTITRIPTAGAEAFPLPAVAGFTSRQLRLLTDEMRSVPMEWFWMTPRAG